MANKPTAKLQHSFVDKFIYLFDNTLTRGSLWLVYWLMIVTIVVIAVMSAIFIYFEVNPELETMDQASRMLFVELLAPGTLGSEDGTYLYYGLVFIVSMFGIVFFSTLVGLITTAFEERIDSLRRGRSPVIEDEHIVIFGWSEKVPTIIREFVEAYRDEKKSSIVIFGDADKMEMEEQIQSQVSDRGNIKVICRSGKAGELQASKITSVNTAKAIIVVAPETEESDIHVIKNLMAIVKNPERRKRPYQIVTEIRDPHNTELASIVGGDEVDVISVTESIARLIAQTSGQAGLPTVYDELLSFTGNEFHFCKLPPEMTDHSFGELVLGYEQSALIGIARNGYQDIVLKPAFDNKLQVEDQLIVLAESKRRALAQFNDTPQIEKTAIIHPEDKAAKPIKTLILGHNWKLPMILKRLNEMVPAKSSLTFMADIAMDKEESAQYQKKLNNFSNFSFVAGNTADRRHLEQLNLANFDSIIILSPAGEEQVHDGNAHTLVTLLHTRSIIAQANADTTIVTEMLDVQDKKLAQAARVDDFIVSDQIISRIMAQYAQSRHLSDVYSELLEPHGVEVKMYPASKYVKLGTPVNFFTVTKSALECGEIALGYRLSNEVNQKSKNYGIRMNPFKSKMIDGFSQSDKIIVLAE
ncbi:MAG: hypothetical protein ABFQ95_07695 [Pseudomonadota bacterium]